MKTLYIARHAKSSWDFPELTDIDRPLNGRGNKNAPEMGQRLFKRNIKPDLLLSSPANRAFTTAQKIAQEIGYPLEEISTSQEIYHVGSGELMDIVRGQNDSINSLMIFGHNPGFTWFANSLTGENIDNIPTCGIVAIEFDVDSWSNIEAGEGKLIFFDYPKKKASF